MLSSIETERLLYELCVRLGFCLPPAERERLANSPPGTVREFTDAVFVAEGLDPMTADRALYRQVKAMVANAFHQSDLEDDAQMSLMPAHQGQEWWLDESALPDLVWARLRTFEDGKAEVLDMDGRISIFASAGDAANYLMEDEYVRPGSVDPEELNRLGLVPQDLAPPTHGDGPELCRQMHVRVKR
jgi:hypothetical protein